MNDTVDCTYKITECYNNFSYIVTECYIRLYIYIVNDCYGRLYIYSY